MMLKPKFYYAFWNEVKLNVLINLRRESKGLKFQSVFQRKTIKGLLKKSNWDMIDP